MNEEAHRSSLGYPFTGQPSLSAAPNNAAPRKRVSACHRCRQQKVKCDGQTPACSSCVKANAECTRSSTNVETEASRSYTIQLEKRIQWLEEIVTRYQPNVIIDGDGNIQSNDELIPVGDRPSISHNVTSPLDHVSHGNATILHRGNSTSVAQDSPAASSTSQIGPSQPLAHDVGLLSLANSTDPKYLGPSSGVPFARLIFSSAPQSQGLSSAWQTIQHGSLATKTGRHQQPHNNKFAKLPKEDEMSYFVAAYFEAWHTLYPFLLEDSFQEVVDRVVKHEKLVTEPSITSETPTQTFDMAQMFLVLSLGAKVLETRLSVEFSSDQYYSTAMVYVGRLQLHDSIRGVQIMLLLVLCSFSFTDGLNAWFLTSTIIASCLDLGLQRKHVNNHAQNGTTQESVLELQLRELRSGIFWSAYSLDRTLSVILGRPLTLRDEACDIEFPGEEESKETSYNAVVRHKSMSSQMQEPQPKRVCLPRTTSPYLPAIFSFRFDRITAEIKLMIYRVARSPTRFPWPTNLEEWQEQTQQVCTELLNEVTQNLRWGGLTGRRGTLDGTLPLIELKYHQCIMLLYRPSPAFPQPSSPALKACYNSALETIRIQSKLLKFANMVNSWLTAHAVFVSGITLLYCLWTSPQIRAETSLDDFMQHANACNLLLKTLGNYWSVAEDAQVKFARLVDVTAENWKSNRSGSVTPPLQQQQQEQEKEISGEAVGRADASNTYQSVENLPSSFWDPYNTDYMQGPSMIMDELGDIGSWFDLEWLGDSNSTYQLEAYR